MKIKVSGMTCAGCKETVTRALENIDQVKNVTVSLKNGSAIIESENEPSIETLQNSLPEKYQIQKNNSDKPISQSMFLSRINIILSLALTIGILGITTIGVIKVLYNKENIQCACLGTAIKLPMTIATLIENGIMIVMAIITITLLYV